MILTTNEKIPMRHLRDFKISLLIFFLEYFWDTECFNLDVSSATLKRGPPGSYFGYSITPHKVGHHNSDIIFLVGAPRDNASDPLFSNISRPGVLYNCSFHDENTDCTPLPSFREFVLKDEDYNDQWFGGVVVSQNIPSGQALACGHKYGKVSSARSETPGWCISLTNNLKPFKFHSPCNLKHGGYFDYAVCQAGVSAFIDKDGEILLGAPGAHLWRGVVFGGNLRNELDGEEGMSISTSHNMAKQGRKVYVVGAPRSDNVGEVLLLQKVHAHTFLVKVRLKGQQMGSRFGHKVLVIDVNGDGYKLDDLVVGAPLYHGVDSCGGAIYVYMSTKATSTASTDQTKNFHDPWFGSDIVSLGDLDRDDFNDFAVGSPYEGRGRVYIFRGGITGPQHQPSQIIEPSSFQHLFNLSFSSFGFSLASNGFDLDSNLHPDLLIGSYLSDAVVLLRSSPVIDIRVSIKNEPKLINPNVNVCGNDKMRGRNDGVGCFVMRLCFNYYFRKMRKSGKLVLMSHLKSNNSAKHNSSINDSVSQAYFKFYVEKANTTPEKLPTAETFSTSSQAPQMKLFNKTTTASSQIIVHTTAKENKDNGNLNCVSHDVYLEQDNHDYQNGINFHLSYELISFTPLNSSSSSHSHLNPVLSVESSRGLTHVRRSQGELRDPTPSL
ncbi:hypothetical protein HELRODRAFT_191408 [Helobdella robusta]|uniref:Integrin alpha first immunoglubulin-like domain-containing protein n=1 Tax=Helobdella robusta TaxID=6412 RepID=T1FSY6_HELRO|nr:hypothetical protein HELRODRAFT_191408 [Helobdella robusta]ESO05207.1 hypothetical protein HELRODRAFT_191408 [Helobdella robusta]